MTEEQDAQLKALRLEHYKTMKPVNKVIDQQTSLINKLQKKQLTHTLEFRELLTDEQVMKLDQKRMHAGKTNSPRGHKMRTPGQGRGAQM